MGVLIDAPEFLLLKSYLTPTPSELVTRYLICFITLNIFIGPLVLLFPSFPYEWSNVRNWQILLTLACVLHVIFHRQKLADYLTCNINKTALYLFSVSVLISYLFSVHMHYFGFLLNGMDFSIFDWMLYNTSHREFMNAPVCGDCNHFGIHPTYIMLPLVYLHRLWTSPFMLQTVQAVCVWVAGLLVWRIAKFYKLGDFVALLLAIAFWTNSWTGSIVILGFHSEVFYLPIGLLLIDAWLRQKTPLIWLAALLFLSIKEDAAFYLIAMMIGVMIFERKRIGLAMSILMLAVSVGAVNFLVAQPHFLAMSGTERPQYLLRFWGSYGASKAEIIQTMLTSPVRVFIDVVTSRWYWLYGAALFVPLLAPRAFFAALPILIIHGTARGEPTIRNYSMYYSAALLPFLLWGFCEGSARLLAYDVPAVLRRNAAIVILATISFCFVGGGYLRFPAPRYELLQDMAALRADPTLSVRPICAQTILHPHLPYEWELKPIDQKCLARPGSYIVMHSELSRIPLHANEYDQLGGMSDVVQVLDGGTQIRRLR